LKLAQYTIEREFNAPPKRLYEAYTRPEQLAAWLWGDFARACRAEIELRVNDQLKVEIDFEAKGQATLLRLTHSGISDDDISAKEQENSIRATLEFLNRLVTGALR
jgi:hypothetical protein